MTVDYAEEILAKVHDALAKRDGARPHVVAFDLDGTLVVDRPKGERHHAVLPDVHPPIAAVAAFLLREGHHLLVVTGRETEEEARRDTVRALTAALGDHPDDSILSRITISAGGLWKGNKTAVVRKVKALREHGAAVIVGDLVHLDGAAARVAGIPFVRVR